MHSYVRERIPSVHQDIQLRQEVPVANPEAVRETAGTVSGCMRWTLSSVARGFTLGSETLPGIETLPYTCATFAEFITVGKPPWIETHKLIGKN